MTTTAVATHRGSRRADRMRMRLAVGSAGLALAATIGFVIAPPTPVNSEALSACAAWNDGAREMWNGKEFECAYVGFFRWEWVLVGRGREDGGRF